MGHSPVGQIVALEHAEAVELFRHTAWLMRNDNFFEVKRNRTRSVDVPMMEWYREQRAKQQAEQAAQQKS